MDIIFDLGRFAALTATGAVVGLAVGLTGVGGGSLMTPALISLFRVSPVIAIGTDLAFAAITKTAGLVAHRRSGLVQWRIALLMIAGSVPACLLALAWMVHLEVNNPAPQTMSLIQHSLGFALLATAFSLAFKDRLHRWVKPVPDKYRPAIALTASALIGALVAFSSIGAGAIGCTAIALIFRELDTKDIAATDIVYAIPLTSIAAIGHAWAGHLDVVLLSALLVGSVPAVYLGIRLSKRISNGISRNLLTGVLLLAATKSLLS